MPAWGEHRSRSTALPNTPPGVITNISGLSGLDVPKIVNAVHALSPDVLQPRQRKRRNSLPRRCNNIAGAALVLKHHRNSGRSP
jgi:hypothetical protein